MSAADQAALEMALQCRDHSGEDVVVITAGPPAADAVLRDALGAGATIAIRVDVPFDSPSRAVATELASQLGEARLVWCGDYSFDRGSGSVPAFIAAELDAAQALGLVGVEHETDETLTVTRRLDGGRREVLRISDRAVLSLEGSIARLRRAPLRALRSSPPIEVRRPTVVTVAPSPAVSRPYRPRPRALAAPVGATALERVKSLTAVGTAIAHGESVTLPPAEAADRILEALRSWGYIATDG